MNKLCRAILLMFAAGLLAIPAVRAFEVPSYIQDPQKVNDNICVIIKENTVVRKNSQTAQDLFQKTNETIREYAARLYADALSIRAGMSSQGGNLAAAEKLAGSLLGSSDKHEVLQNDVKPHIKNIALHVKQIVELEAAIANLQGAQLLSGMDEVSCEDAADEEDEQ